MTQADAIRKILALQARACDGASPEEAAACARKAAELKVKFGISSDQLRRAQGQGGQGGNGSPAPRQSRTPRPGGLRPAPGAGRAEARHRPPPTSDPVAQEYVQEIQRQGRQVIHNLFRELERSVLEGLK